MTQLKDQRFALRMSRSQRSLIERAAHVEGMTMTDFTLAAVTAHAQDVLVDRHLFRLDEQAWDRFEELLDRPVEYKPELVTLFATPPVFD